jgi:2-oxoglutarate-dependent dioxygenase
MTSETIPVIDLEKISEQFECKKLRDACEKWGCFRIINHSIPLTRMAEMRMVVDALHDLPMDIKKNNKDVISGRGYFPPSALNPLLESFGLYDMGASQATHDFCSQLNATPHQRYATLKKKD